MDIYNRNGAGFWAVASGDAGGGARPAELDGLSRAAVVEGRSMPTVLIVEDDASSRTSLADALADVGMDVVTAEHGAEAIELLSRRSIDVIITDLMMKKVDGLDLIGHVKEHYPSIPVIVVTAFLTSPMASEAMERGAYGCLPKPIDLNRLESAVQSACRPAGR